MSKPFISEYDRAQCTSDELIIYVVHAFGRVFETYYPLSWDTPCWISVQYDGQVYMSSDSSHPPLLLDKTFYIGDDWHIGNIEFSDGEYWINLVSKLTLVKPDRNVLKAE